MVLQSYFLDRQLVVSELSTAAILFVGLELLGDKQGRLQHVNTSGIVLSSRIERGRFVHT